MDNQSLKIVDNYIDFTTEKNSGRFKDAYEFFYNTDGNLISVDQLVSKEVITNKKIAGLTSYRTELINDKTGTKSLNKFLQFDVNFPSYKTISLKITMKASDITSQIVHFPYIDSSVEFPKKVDVSIIHNDNYRKEILNYINERNDFIKIASVSASSYGEERKPSNLIDGKLNTSWEVDKTRWVINKETYIEIAFPESREVSQVRWISPHPSRLPLSYDYEIRDLTTNTWKKIYSIEGGDFLPNKYVIDSFKTVKTKTFRMVIRKTLTGDFPGISEIELLKGSSNVDSSFADLL